MNPHTLNRWSAPLATALALLLLPPAFAQTAAKNATKADAAKAKPAATKKAPAPVSASRQQLKSAANQVASGVRAAEAALTPEELKLAERVYAGKLPCELGASVEIEADPKSPGYFNLSLSKGPRFRMIPVASRTGAIRLEDQHAGAVWLQLANKSMLMDQKAGKRLADECMSAEQEAMAQALKTNPAPSLLDAPSVKQVPLPSAPNAVAVVPPASPAAATADPPAASPSAPASAAR